MSPMRLPALLFLVSLLAACASAPPEAPLLRVETVRYAADTTGAAERGPVRQRITEAYDGRGNVVFAEYRTGSGDLQMRFVSRVVDGVRTRTDWRREDGSLALYVTYAYDAAGRLAESRRFGPDGALLGTTLSRYPDGDRVREQGPPPADGEAFAPNAVYELGPDGEPVRLTEFGEGGAVIAVFEYAYPARDARGRWTVKHTTRDGALSQIDERTLTDR